jgi:hypothetical protein
MLIVALVMAIIGLAALVTAVVTSNEIIAWVCIVASVIGVVLLIIDALRERQRRDVEPGAGADAAQATDRGFDAEYPDDAADHPETETAEAEEPTGERPHGDAGDRTEAGGTATETPHARESGDGDRSNR